MINLNNQISNSKNDRNVVQICFKRFVCHSDFESVERLFSVSSWPPKSWIRNCLRMRSIQSRMRIRTSSLKTVIFTPTQNFWNSRRNFRCIFEKKIKLKNNTLLCGVCHVENWRDFCESHVCLKVWFYKRVSKFNSLKRMNKNGVPDSCISITDRNLPIPPLSKLGSNILCNCMITTLPTQSNIARMINRKNNNTQSILLLKVKRIDMVFIHPFVPLLINQSTIQKETKTIISATNMQIKFTILCPFFWSCEI
mmetsp:Transcript_26339/g.36705  ORF Transcript_26339/g.36705 Transcript_26339/m.36705 type:complete len:253 (-) Transcript_26339:144-902(-)